MTHFNWKLNFFMVLLADCCRAYLSPSGEHVCLKPEIYQDTIFVEEKITEVYTETEWCPSVSNFFRCNVKKNRVKKVRMPRVVQRTRIVPECCDGYEEDPKTNSSCIPVCSVECIHGVCISPEMCACDSGFYGVNCQTPCPLGRWGRNCSEECDCLNDAECGRVNGYCSCRPGWQGYRCEYPCPEGYHGHLCQERCDCRGRSCDHITGNCFTTTTEMPTSSTTEIASPEKETISKGNFVDVDHRTETEHEIFITEIISVKSGGKGIPVTESQITGVESKFKTTETVHKSDIFETELEPVKKESEEIIFEKKTYEEVENESNPSEVLLTTTQVEIIREHTTSPTSSTSEGTERPSDYLTDNLAINETDNNGGGDELSSHADFTMFRFIPSLTLLTGVSILIFIIAARWMIINYRMKGKRMGKHKDDGVFNVEGRKSFQRDSFLVDNTYATENSIYLSDLEFNKVAPILQTFKPLKMDVEKSSEET